MKFNIHFCGTQIKATRKGTASLEAIKQVDNTLILSGVGAASTYDKENDVFYPTPGTFYFNDEDLKPKKKRFHFGDRFFQTAGLICGAGEEDNINYAMQKIYMMDIKEQNNSSLLKVNLSGYSRGGASAIRLANAIYKKYGHRIKLNLFLIDANAGPGRHNLQEYKNIPRNVENIYFTFSQDEKNPLYQSPEISYYRISDKTNSYTRESPGNHQAQELIPLTGENASAKTNQSLLESFYKENINLNKNFKKFDNIPNHDKSFKDYLKALDEFDNGIICKTSNLI